MRKELNRVEVRISELNTFIRNNKVSQKQQPAILEKLKHELMLVLS